MSELAKTHIEIIDESAYSSGVSAIIPLYVFATEQDKVINEDTGEIAPGTSLSNELLVMTSQKDVIDTFGIPSFNVVDGTVIQGDETNEIGLYALYDGLSSASLAYALRADIDLKQLKETNAEPTSKVANNTLWLDTASSMFGLFRANGDIRNAKAWDLIENILLPSDSELDENKVPVSTYGNDGDVAIVYNGTKQVIYENVAQKWVEIGTSEWVESYPSFAKGSKDGSYTSNSKIRVQGVEITLPLTNTIPEAVDVINKALDNNEILNVRAFDDNGTGLLIKNSSGLLTLEDVEGYNALESLGFKMSGKQVLVDTVSVVHGTHIQTPNGSVVGSIWIKTSEPMNGSKYVLKQYKKSTNYWETSKIGMYGSYLEAEKSLSNLSSDSIIVKYDMNHLGESYLSQFGSQKVNVIQATNEPKLNIRDSFVLRTLVNGMIKSYTITIGSEDVEKLAKTIANLKIPNIISDVVEVTENEKVVKYLRIVNTDGYTIELVEGSGKVLEDLGLQAGEYSKWEQPNVIVKSSEPTAIAKEGTLWFNRQFAVDIMVNKDNKWNGYKNVYPDAEIMVSSVQPEKHEDGTSLVDYDLWINSASENYPEIMRYMGGEWEMVDNTDQTSPLGILFADARQNAGPSYTDSKHKEFSVEYKDMMISDYVDPNCPNPMGYSADMLLFNTLYSTNNVKVMTDEYKNARKELGDTFQVGESPEFATPGTELNKETTRWSTISGNDVNGVGIFGRKAQRTMVVRALVEAIKTNDDIRSMDYDFFFASCPGYPELDDELISLNVDKKEMFMIIADTPSRLAPNANEIIEWGSNKNNVASHGEEGRILRNAYVTRTYPPVGLTSNVDGYEVAVPSSIAKMKNLLVLPRGMAAAGTQYGQVTNLASVGYITDEEEYAPITVKTGLGEIITNQSINPIMPQRNTGLLIWGMSTENGYTSALSDETSILTILRLKRELDEACLPFFFQPNTEAVRRDFDSALRTILSDYVLRNELYDFALVTDRTVNTNERIERNELWADISIDITRFIKQIYIPIRIVRTGSLS